jgi:iron-sulfur cluster repair protein YtfE (RIC family)
LPLVRPKSIGQHIEALMTLLDKVIAAVVPEPSPDKRADCRAKARSLSGGSGWLAQVLDHHEQIEAAFEAVREAASPTARRAAQKWLSTLLTGHSMAEEAVLYPAMALGDHKAHSTEAYTEQSGAKVQTAGLDELEPMSKDYLDKLEHLRSAVAMHVYREESDWFPELRKSGDAAAQSKLSRRYKEEFERYMGTDAAPR